DLRVPPESPASRSEFREGARTPAGPSPRPGEIPRDRIEDRPDQGRRATEGGAGGLDRRRGVDGPDRRRGAGARHPRRDGGSVLRGDVLDGRPERRSGCLGLRLEVSKGSLVVLDPRTATNLLGEKKDWLEGLRQGIRSVQEQRGLDLIVIDSLEALEVLAKFKDRRREIYRLFEWLRDLGI